MSKMYKIIELNERQLPEFKGKIIQVINSVKCNIDVGRNYLGIMLFDKIWVLTCLAEVEDDERR